MNFKKTLSLILVFCFFSLPFFSFAQSQNPAPTYNHTTVGETSAVIEGTIFGSGLNLGYAIIFGAIPQFLINVAPIIPNIDGSYSIKINNLLGSTNYYYQMVYGPTASAVGPVKTFKTTASSLILNHQDINQAGAKIVGTVSPGHPNFIIKYGKTTDIKDGSFSLGIDSYGGFSQYFPLSFPPETTVFYRAVDPVLHFVYYSPLKSFTTISESVNFDIRNLTSSSVSIFGSVTNGTPAPRVLLSIDGPVSPQTVEIQNDPVLDETNSWQANFNGLEPNTKYFARVAKRSDPTYTYLIKDFTTTSSDVVLQFFNVTDVSMKVSGNLPFGTDSIILCFATDKTNLVTSPDCGSGPISEAVLDSSVFETTITNLAPNTIYYFVVRNETNTKDISEVFEIQTFPPAGPGNIGNDIVLPVGPDSLVPCKGLDCDFNSLMKLANNIIDFLLKRIALPIFALIFAYVGWLYMSSAANPSQRSKAKGILINSVVGFIIAMAAFLIIELILTTLGYEGISFINF